MPKIRLKNVRERARGKHGQRPCIGHHVWSPWDPRLEHPSGPVWPTRSPRGADVAASDWLPSSSLFSISFPSIYIRNPEQNSLQFLISYFDHISLISTLNWVIQKLKLLVLKRATNPKHFQIHLSSSFFPVIWFQYETQLLYVKLLLLTSSFDHLF